jgi:hypothetical protein
MKKIFILFLTIFSYNIHAQVSDDFSDGDFTNNPAWTGDVSSWQVVSGQLVSNGPAVTNTVLQLVTPSAIVNDATWEFFANPKLGTSSGNYLDVFLISNTADLNTSLNGYFVRIGGTPDEISLFRKDGTTEVKIIDGLDGVIASSSNNPVNIKVTRTTSNVWTLERDYGLTGTFTSEGSIADATYTTSTHFGVLVKYSSANSQKFFFDNFNVGQIVVDLQPPVAQTITVLSQNSIEIDFNENIELTSAQTVANYSVNNGLNNPVSATRNTTDLSKVTLVFATNFTSALQNTISIENVSDIVGNVISTPQELDFTYFAPFAAQKGDIIINELMADFSPVVGLPEREFVEIYNTTNQTINLTNFKLSDPTSTATLGNYNFLSKSYLIICANADTALFRPFGNILGVSSFPSLNNGGDLVTLKNQNGDKIDEVEYALSWYNDATKDDGGWTLERKNPYAICTGSTNWSASNDANGGTPGTQNSIFDTIPDTTAPILNSVSIVSANSLLLTFNEPMDTTSFAAGNYVFNPSLTFQSAQIQVNTTSVLVTTSTAISSGLVYTLSVSNVKDCSGNEIQSNLKEFGIGKTPEKGDVIFNELLPDEAPSVGLPEIEFLELFNTSNTLIDLKDCKLSDLSTTAILPQTILKPNEYLIITTTSGVASYTSYGKTIGITLPSLNNSGDKFSLKTPTDELIDEVEYALSWYGDAAKDDGGWTLERKNPFTKCTSSQNWSASMNANGGTPGTQNSIFDTIPDTTPPVLNSVVIAGQNSFLLTFNEPMDTSSFATGSYVFDTLLTFQSAQIQPNRSTVLVFTTTPIDTGFVFIFSVSNIKDCSGNIMTSKTLELGIGRTPNAGEIIFNELLPDETPSVGLPEIEFLELYNKTNSLLDLKDCKLSDNSTIATLPQVILKPNEYLIVTTVTGLPLYSVYGKTIGISLPSLNNTGDQFQLKTPTGTVIDEVEYAISWYKNADKDDGGWTLERINPETPCSGSNNWKASENAQGGTPGTQNSVYSTAPDLVAPKLLSATIDSVNRVLLTFDEAIDIATFNTATYSFSNNLQLLSTTLLTDFSKIQLNTSAIDTGVVYLVTVTGIKDCPGNNISTSNNKSEFGIGKTPQQFEIIINEIMADETPSVGLPEIEYLEIYNNSNTLIELKNCKISDLTSIATLPAAIVKPGEYVLLTTTTNALEMSVFGKAIGVSGLPSLNNSGDKFSIFNTKNQLIHSVYYSDSWYGNANKKDGGWSLEMIDVNNPCSGALNWTASVDSRGGTPAKINSVAASNPDLTAPSFVRADAENDSTVVLTFNETLDSMSVLNGNYSIDNQVEVKKIMYYSATPEKIKLTTSVLKIKTIYTATVSGIRDCIGNTSFSQTTTFVLPEQGDSLDIVINEVLFNPRVGGVDFVEIFNKGLIKI